MSTDDEAVNRKSKKKKSRKEQRAEGNFSKLCVNVDLIILPRMESFISKRI